MIARLSAGRKSSDSPKLHQGKQNDKLETFFIKLTLCYGIVCAFVRRDFYTEFFSLYWVFMCFLVESPHCLHTITHIFHFHIPLSSLKFMICSYCAFHPFFMTQHLKKVGVVWSGHVPLGTANHIPSWVLVFVSMTRLRRAVSIHIVFSRILWFSYLRGIA